MKYIKQCHNCGMEIARGSAPTVKTPIVIGECSDCFNKKKHDCRCEELEQRNKVLEEAFDYLQYAIKRGTTLAEVAFVIDQALQEKEDIVFNAPPIPYNEDKAIKED